MTGLSKNTVLQDASQEEELPPVCIVFGSSGEQMMKYWLAQNAKTCVHLVPFNKAYDRIGHSVRLTKRTHNFKVTSNVNIENNTFIAGHIVRSTVSWESYDTSVGVHHWEAVKYKEIWDLAVYTTTQFAHENNTYVCRINNPVAQFDAEGAFEMTDYSANIDGYQPRQEVFTWKAKFLWLCNGPDYIRDGEWHVYDVQFDGRKVLVDE